MSYSSIALLRIDRKIKVASTLLDITRQIYGNADANLLQHLAELTSSRQAVLREQYSLNLPEVNGATAVPAFSPTPHQQQRCLKGSPT